MLASPTCVRVCLGLDAVLARPSQGPEAPTSAACSRLVPVALTYLTRLSARADAARAHGDPSDHSHAEGAGNGRVAPTADGDPPGWPAAALDAVLESLICCWRQAALQPLRTDPIDWPRFLHVVSALPPCTLGLETQVEPDEPELEPEAPPEMSPRSDPRSPSEPPTFAGDSPIAMAAWQVRCVPS